MDVSVLISMPCMTRLELRRAIHSAMHASNLLDTVTVLILRRPLQRATPTDSLHADCNCICRVAMRTVLVKAMARTTTNMKSLYKCPGAHHQDQQCPCWLSKLCLKLARSPLEDLHPRHVEVRACLEVLVRPECPVPVLHKLGAAIVFQVRLQQGVHSTAT